MSRSSVLTLAQVLANGQADPDLLGAFYDDAMQDVARQALFNGLRMLPVTAGQGVYDRPADLVTTLAVFYDDVMLSLVTQRELEAVGMAWRDRIGVPHAWMHEDLSHEVFRLVPAPVSPSEPVVPVHGAPFGLDSPAGTVALLASERRRDLPDWMDLPLALITLAKEFARPSPHLDLAFSAACRSLGTTMLAMVA